MKPFAWSGNYLVWGALEGATMAITWRGMSCLIGIAGVDVVGRSITPATILLNELSALSALNEDERRSLRAIVQPRVRALVWLVIFFVGFIFLILTASAFRAAGDVVAQHVLAGVGVGCGASLVLIAGVLVDLNEVADYRWEVELRDVERKRREAARAELDAPGPGFADDEHLQGYKRVINDR